MSGRRIRQVFARLRGGSRQIRQVFAGLRGDSRQNRQVFARLRRGRSPDSPDSPGFRPFALRRSSDRRMSCRSSSGATSVRNTRFIPVRAAPGSESGIPGDRFVEQSVEDQRCANPIAVLLAIADDILDGLQSVHVGARRESAALRQHAHECDLRLPIRRSDRRVGCGRSAVIGQRAARFCLGPGHRLGRRRWLRRGFVGRCAGVHRVSERRLDMEAPSVREWASTWYTPRSSRMQTNFSWLLDSLLGQHCDRLHSSTTELRLPSATWRYVTALRRRITGMLCNCGFKRNDTRRDSMPSRQPCHQDANSSVQAGQGITT